MGSGGPLIIIWIVVFFGIFYFLAVRPQRRQRQAHGEMVAMLKKGDDVVTIGGMFGTVRRLGDDWVELEVARGTRVRFLKKAISQIVSEEEEEDEEYADELEAADDEVVEEELVEEEVVDEEPSRKSVVEGGARRRGDPGRGRRGAAGLTSAERADDDVRRALQALPAGPVPCRDSSLRREQRSDVVSNEERCSMMRVLAFANQKGGVAKTTSTVNLGAALCERGKRVLAVDMDPQGNLTMSQGIDTEGLDKSMYDVLVHRTPIEEVIYERELHVAASTIDLAGAEMALSSMIGRERALQRAIEPDEEEVRLHPDRHAAVARAADHQRADRRPTASSCPCSASTSRCAACCSSRRPST